MPSSVLPWGCCQPRVPNCICAGGSCFRLADVTDERRFYEAAAGADARRSAPAVLRNREYIAEVLSEWLPERGLVLEVASGTGEHVVFFAERFPKLEWPPSAAPPDALVSIASWRDASGLPNVRPPLELDACAALWP